jgi:hypothetical protein
VPAPEAGDPEDDLGAEGDDDDLLDDDDELGGDLDDEEEFDDDEGEGAVAEGEEEGDDAADDEEEEEEVADVVTVADCEMGDRLELVDPSNSRRLTGTVIKIGRKAVALRCSVKALSGEFDDARLAAFGAQLMAEEEGEE